MVHRKRRRNPFRPLPLAAALTLAVAPTASARSGFLSIGGEFASTRPAPGLGAFGVLFERERVGVSPSWYAWFETRRDGFVADRWPDGVPPEPDEAWRAARDEAAEALAQAWEDRDGTADGGKPVAGGEAAAEEKEAALVLALGRIGGDRAEAILTADRGPIASPRSAVRGMTRLALGLLGTDAARARLLADLTGDDPAAAAGAAAGMTLLPSLREEDERALFQAVRRGPGGDARRLALQALAVQGSRVNARLMPAVLREVPRVFLAEQALLAATAFNNRPDQDLLRDYLSVGGRLGGFPARNEVVLFGPSLLGGRSTPGFRGGPQVSYAVASDDPQDSLQDRGGPDGGNVNDRGGRGGGSINDRGRSGGGNTLQDRGPVGGGNPTIRDRGNGGRDTLSDRGPVRRPDRDEDDDTDGPGLDGRFTVPPVFVGGRSFPNPLEQRLEAAAALGLSRLKPSEDGFPEDAVEDLVEEIRQSAEPGSNPSRAAMLLALGYLAAEEREGVPDLVLRYADGDEPDRDGPRRIRGPRLVVGDGGPEAAELDRDATESFALLSAGLLTRRLSAGPDAVSVYPLRLSAHDDASLRRDARRVFLKTAGQSFQARGVRVAAAMALGVAADRRDPDGADAFAPGGGLTFDPTAIADGDPLVLAALLASLETLAGQPVDPTPASREAESRVRARTDAFLATVAVGLGREPLTPLGLAAARRVVQSLAHRPAGVPVDEDALARLAAADPFLGVDIAAASRWRNDPTPAGALAARLDRPDAEGAAAAWALGALFDARSPSPLWRLARQSNPVSIYREDASRLLLLSRGSVAGGVTLFNQPRWWRDADDALVLEGWPNRDELAVANPYLATRWDERLLRDD